MIHISQNTPLIVRLNAGDYGKLVGGRWQTPQLRVKTEHVRSGMKCLWQAGSPTTAYWYKQKHKSQTVHANTVPSTQTRPMEDLAFPNILHDFSFIKQKKQTEFLTWATTRVHRMTRVSTSRVHKLLHDSNTVFFFIEDSRFGGVLRCVSSVSSMLSNGPKKAILSWNAFWLVSLLDPLSFVISKIGRIAVCTVRALAQNTLNCK